MSLWVPVVVLLFVTNLVAIGLSAISLRQVALIAVGAQRSPDDYGPGVGRTLPAFTTRLLTGEGFRRSGGRPQVLFFASTTCRSCKMLIPDAIATARGAGLATHTFVVNDHDDEPVNGFVDAHLDGCDGVHLIEPAVLTNLNVAATPFAVFVDPRGQITRPASRTPARCRRAARPRGATMDHQHLSDTDDLIRRKAVRTFTRRTFVSRATRAFAGAATTALVGTAVADRAYAAGSCFPPYGQYCSGCDYYGNCPEPYHTCTSSDNCDNAPCPYASGYWTAPCTGGTTVVCRDCHNYVSSDQTPCSRDRFCACRGQKQIDC